jgi:hypothetical protein
MAVDTSPRTYRFLPTEVWTSSRRVAGKIMVSSTGAIGILNDPTHSILDVHDAHSAPLGPAPKMSDHFELLRLVKARIGVVLMPRREDLGPLALVRGGYTSNIEYPVRITMHMFEIEGVVEFPGRFDLATLMNEGSREFIPLLNAAISGTLNPELRVQGGGVLVNRRHIELVALLSQRVKPAQPQKP